MRGSFGTNGQDVDVIFEKKDPKDIVITLGQKWDGSEHMHGLVGGAICKNLYKCWLVCDYLGG